MSDDKSWSTIKDNFDKVTYIWLVSIHDISRSQDSISEKFGDVANDVQFRLSIKYSNHYTIRLHPEFHYHRRYMFKVDLPDHNIRKESKTYFSPDSGEIRFDERINHIEHVYHIYIHCTIIIEKVSKVPIYTLSEDFGALFNADKFSDVTIETAGGHKIPAHKNILSARSNVFAAMFNHDTMENQMNCVTIDDFSQKVVMEMLHYMYTGTAPKIKKVAEDLLVAADKYGLDELKEMCLKSLNDNITIENVARVFRLAEVYEDNGLVSKSVHFIKTHPKSVAETPDWKSLLKTDKDLIFKEFIEPKALVPMDFEVTREGHLELDLDRKNSQNYKKNNNLKKKIPIYFMNIQV